MRSTLLRFALPALAALLLIACTRDRPTPEATAVATPAAGATSAAGTVVTGTTNAEPVVTVANATPTPAATEVVTATAEAAVDGTLFEYTVKPGETLAAIAAKFDTEVQTLRELNYLLDDNIFAGQILQVPYQEGMTAEGAPTPTPEPYTYEVQSGDTLSSIAMQFNVKPGTLIEVNSITDPNNLTIGSRLLIPGYVPPNTGDSTDSSDSSGGATGSGDSGSTGDNGSAGVTHVVQPGETLSAIAADYGVDSVAILQANNIANGNLIRVGQKLVIPGITARQALESRGTRHTVASGESLSGIAQQYGVTVEAILAANSLDDPNTIVVGQELLIPPPQ